MKQLLEKIEGDKVIWMVVVILSFISILAVYSSTGSLAFRMRGGNTEYYMLKQAFILLSGLIIMFMIHKIKYSHFSKFAVLLFFIAVPLLLYTLLSGTELNQANRWITIPILQLTFQSSDLAKLAVIIFIARSIAVNSDSLDDVQTVTKYIFFPVALVVILIFPANFSTAALLTLISFLMMLLGGVSVKILAKFSLYIGMFFAVAIILILLINPSGGRVHTWKNRVQSFVSGEKEESSQSEQAKIAIANGRLLGKMPGNSIQKNFLPHPYSDFIYAFIIEEYGLFGGVVVLLMYLILLFRGIRIAIRAPGYFGGLVALGVTLMLVFQAFINMLVAVGLMPVTGQPLPLVSMGGTSIWFTCVSIGILLSVSREVTIKEEVKNAA